jgi:serralysin
MAKTTGVSKTGVQPVDGLLEGVKWADSNLTYSFPTQSAFYGSTYGSGEPGSAFEALNLVQITAVESILGMYAATTHLAFTRLEETETQHADLRFAMSDVPGTAWAYYPSESPEGGDTWFNNSTGWYDSPHKGNYAYTTAIHEIGHSLGLKHAHETEMFGAVPRAYDSMEYTIMSYRSYEGGSTTSGYTNETWGYAQSLMMYDIAALQHLYGADFGTNAGDTTYRWDPLTGQSFIDGIGQGAPGGNRIFQTLWDGGGRDTYDFSNYTTNLRVNLNPGEWTIVSDVQRANLGHGQFADGNIANALLHQNNPASLIEDAIGGIGDDVLIGNSANNALVGGAGRDLLVGGAGSDALDGGLGIDTAVFSGSRANYSVVLNADGSFGVQDLRAGSPDGTDVVRGVEFFQFGDWVLDASAVVADRMGVATDRTLSGTFKGNTLLGDARNERLFGFGGNDSLNGGTGSDHIVGGAGADMLTGGAGADNFVFESLSDSNARGRDTILDFTAGDHIDLRLIDASTQQAGDQAFAYIDSGAFTGHAGQLRFSGGLLSADTNGDRVADFEVAVRFTTGVTNAVTSLTVSDFYL